MNCPEALSNYLFLCFVLRSTAELQLESSIFEGSVVIRIRSVKENSYLCVNSRGNLTVEVSKFVFRNHQDTQLYG